MPFTDNVITGGALARMTALSWVGFRCAARATDYLRE